MSAQIAAPVIENHLADDDFTGQHRAMPEEQRDPKKLKDKRRTRTDSDRIEHLEERADHHDEVLGKIDDKVGRMEPELSKMSGKLDILPKLVELVEMTMSAAHEREHVTFTAQVDVDTAKAKTEIEKQAAIAVAEAKDEIKDRASKREARRKIWVKVLGGAIATVAAIAAGGTVHWLIHKITGWL